jgi:hypothetical protein
MRDALARGRVGLAMGVARVAERRPKEGAVWAASLGQREEMDLEECRWRMVFRAIIERSRQ